MKERRISRDWESWLDQRIREAQERGEFDDLPGKGKPLDLAPSPYTGDRELAFKVLKDAGYAPEWIELDKALRGKLDRARAVLARCWERRETRRHELAGLSDSWSQAERIRAETSWEKAVSGFELEVEVLNKEIAELNLKVPSSRFQRSGIDAGREVARLMGSARE